MEFRKQTVFQLSYQNYIFMNFRFCSEKPLISGGSFSRMWVSQFRGVPISYLIYSPLQLVSIHFLKSELIRQYEIL